MLLSLIYAMVCVDPRLSPFPLVTHCKRHGKTLLVKTLQALATGDREINLNPESSSLMPTFTVWGDGCWGRKGIDDLLELCPSIRCKY